MWSQILLCMLVGVALASNTPAWKDNTEYVYQVRGRTLASLHEVSNQYSGILLKARLTIRPRSEGKLYAQISEAKYGQVHTELPEGWNSNIPDSELSYKDLSMSGKPFQIVMKNGVVHDLIVEKEVSNWEANIIKSIVSQFQLDTQAENLVDSHVNTLPEEHSNTAVFKTMEDTVTGKTETLYDIHLMPEHILESRPWLVPQPQLKGDGEYIEIVKSKNYSRSEQRPLYHYGLGGMENSEPASNQMGEYFIRNSMSNIVVSGNLRRYTIQNSYTVNKIIMSPTLADKQQGSVISMLNVTLAEVRPQSSQVEELSNPIALGSLVYRFNTPYTGNQVRAMEYKQQKHVEDSSEERFNSPSQGRFRRNTEEQQLRAHKQQQYSSYEEDWQQQEQPKMRSAPKSPLLPMTMGYKGNSIKKDSTFNIVENVQKIAQEIGQELESPEKILKQDTLNKYTILCTLIRIMDSEELEQAAKQLYTQSEKGQQRGAWVAFRDAVAECGTGPAFLAIKEWIQTQKVKGQEAADLVAVMSESVREPTEEYMREFYQLCIKHEVKSQRSLNESAILSYTNLIRKVYVNKRQSHNQYPVHSFGTFNTQEGQTFLKEEVIPYLTKELHEAIAQADSHKIHVYIRALGNVAHRLILAAFEPYLEGHKQASQFQRLMMVVALDKLVEIKPDCARSVLYKIYQNAGEKKEVRIAAVYQLMRTSPPTDMLQRMAENTNVDTDEHVNAAVKSSIETAAELQGQEYQYLRSSARAAKPLLTKKTYGLQQSYNHLRSFVLDEMKLTYKQTVQTIGSEDAFLPKGLRYALRTKLGGLKRHVVDMQAMVSSIDELARALFRQTETYKQEQQQKTQQGDSGKWSSEHIARMLNLRSEEREQLEGIFNMELGGLQKMWTFDNHTIEQLPELIRRLEEVLRTGKSFHYTKMLNRKEIAISFPTEMGFPFLYTYDEPALVRFEGKIKAESTPKVSNGNTLNKPEIVSGSLEMRVTISGKTQGRLTFVTPFDHQQYIAGFDKYMQVHIPLRGQIHVDVKNQQVKTEFEPLEQSEQHRMLHYSSWPYTSRSDIKNLEPIHLRPTTQQIKGNSQQLLNKVWGQQQTGAAFRVELVHEQNFINTFWMARLAKQQSLTEACITLWNDGAIQHSQLNIRYVPQESTLRKFAVRFGYQKQYKSQAEEESNESSRLELSQMTQMPTESLARQQDFIKKVATGIHNVDTHVADASIEFQGEKQIKYTLTAAVAKSNVDSKSKVLVLAQRLSAENKPYQILFSAKNEISNTNGLDLTDSLKHEPMVKSQMKLAFGQQHESASKLHAEIELRRSEERKQYLVEQPIYKQCRHQMEQGNKQLPACANMTVRANLLDRADLKIKYENLKQEYVQVVRQMYDAARFNFFPTLRVQSDSRSNDKEINLKVRFFPNYRAVNVTVQTPTEESTIHNIAINNQWVREVVAVHPVFHVQSRIFGKALALETYRPICVVDKTEACTFNNKTYPISALNKKWTVMLQYVPIEARQQYQKQQQQSVEEQLRRQVENFVVLVRQNNESENKKDIKIIVNLPQSEGKNIEINMRPASGNSGSNPAAKVSVNGQEIQINDKQSHDVNHGLVQIYALRNGEVKVEVRNNFYILYDGSRAKLTTMNGKFRNQVRGICGQFDDSKSNDFLTSEQCVARYAQDFIESYQVEEGQQQRDHKLRGEHNKCYKNEQVLYANVISDFDAGRVESHYNRIEQHSGMCTRFQTRYIEQNGEICFTIRPMPVCKCQERETITKNVAVHCVQKSNVAQLWKNQINKGISPDFSLKQQTKTVQMELPKTCSK